MPEAASGIQYEHVRRGHVHARDRRDSATALGDGFGGATMLCGRSLRPAAKVCRPRSTDALGSIPVSLSGSCRTGRIPVCGSRIGGQQPGTGYRPGARARRTLPHGGAGISAHWARDGRQHKGWVRVHLRPARRAVRATRTRIRYPASVCSLRNPWTFPMTFRVL